MCIQNLDIKSVTILIVRFLTISVLSNLCFSFFFFFFAGKLYYFLFVVDVLSEVCNQVDWLLIYAALLHRR